MRHSGEAETSIAIRVDCGLSRQMRPLGWDLQRETPTVLVAVLGGVLASSDRPVPTPR